MPKTTTPYVAFIRWNDLGKYQGMALVNLATFTEENGQLVSRQEEPPIDLNGPTDPRFKEIIGQVAIDQAAEIERLQAQLVEAKNQLQSGASDLLAAPKENLRLQQRLTQVELDYNSAATQSQERIAGLEEIAAALQSENALLRSEGERLAYRLTALTLPLPTTGKD